MSAQPSLFDASAAETDTAPKVEWVDLMSLQASRLLGIPGWTAWRFEAVEPDSVLLTGAVCPEVYKSGPRKGRTNYKAHDPKTKRMVALTTDSRRAFALAWEMETGRCSECQGRGETVASCGVSGTKYRECMACKGSGKPAVRT